MHAEDDWHITNHVTVDSRRVTSHHGHLQSSTPPENTLFPDSAKRAASVNVPPLHLPSSQGKYFQVLRNQARTWDPSAGTGAAHSWK